MSRSLPACSDPAVAKLFQERSAKLSALTRRIQNAKAILGPEAEAAAAAELQRQAEEAEAAARQLIEVSMPGSEGGFGACK